MYLSYYRNIVTDMNLSSNVTLVVYVIFPAVSGAELQVINRFVSLETAIDGMGLDNVWQLKPLMNVRIFVEYFSVFYFTTSLDRLSQAPC